MRNRVLALAAAAAAIGLSVPLTAQAAGLVSGAVPGPDDAFSIGFVFENDLASTLDIISLAVDMSTATPQGLIFDGGPLSSSGPAGATFNVVGGGTSTLTFSFLADGWNPGESFSFTVDPDTANNPGFGATVFDLLGTKVVFGFSDGSSQSYAFVDDPARDAGLVLQAAVPEPSTWAMMILGFGLAGAAMRNRKTLLA
jgi:PEP-CTERM motif